jgi:hypothetical protein
MNLDLCGRLRLKAEACREAIKRSNPSLRDGQSFRNIQDRGSNSGVDLWMIKPIYVATPHDQEFRDLADSFDAAADAVELLSIVARSPEVGDRVRVKAVRLAGEAVGMLREARRQLIETVTQKRLPQCDFEPDQREFYEVVNDISRRWRISNVCGMQLNDTFYLSDLGSLRDEIAELRSGCPKGGAA